MEQEMTLDIMDFYQIVKKRFALILTITLLSTLVSGIVSFFVLKPVYESSTSIIIAKDAGKETTQSDVMMFQNLIKTYAAIAQSDSAAKIAVEKAGLSITSEQLQKSTKVTPQTGTQILVISTQNRDPKVAAAEVNALADAFIQESARVLPTGTVQIMDKGKIPASPVKPNKKLNMAIAFFIGLIASMGISFLLEYMDRTIKSERDIETHLDLPIIGVIPKHSV